MNSKYTEMDCARDSQEFLSKLMCIDSMKFYDRGNHVYFSAKAGYFFNKDKVEMALKACNEYINLLLHEKNLLTTAEVTPVPITGCSTQLVCRIQVTDYNAAKHTFEYKKKCLEEKVKGIFNKYGVMTSRAWSTELVDVSYDTYLGVGAKICITVPLEDTRLNYGYINTIGSKTEFSDELSCSLLSELYEYTKKESIATVSSITGIGYEQKKYFYATCLLICQ